MPTTATSSDIQNRQRHATAAAQASASFIILVGIQADKSQSRLVLLCMWCNALQDKFLWPTSNNMAWVIKDAD